MGLRHLQSVVGHPTSFSLRLTSSFSLLARTASGEKLDDSLETRLIPTAYTLLYLHFCTTTYPVVKPPRTHQYDHGQRYELVRQLAVNQLQIVYEPVFVLTAAHVEDKVA